MLILLLILKGKGNTFNLCPSSVPLAVGFMQVYFIRLRSLFLFLFFFSVFTMKGIDFHQIFFPAFIEIIM